MPEESERDGVHLVLLREIAARLRDILVIYTDEERRQFFVDLDFCTACGRSGCGCHEF